jgi:hypothetical protein
MKTQIAKLLTGLAALAAAGINAQAQDTQPGFGGPPSGPALGDDPARVHYTWTTLDDPLAVGFTTAYWISGNDMIGGYSDSAGNFHGFLYNLQASTWTTLDDPLAAPGPSGGTGLYFISGGQIVGEYWDSSGLAHGFLYNGYTWTTVDDPLGAEGTSLVSFRGDVIGGNYTDSRGVGHAFLYNEKDKTFTPLPDAPLAGTAAGQGTYGVVISNERLLEGYYDSHSVFHGWLYDGFTWTTLDDPLAGSGPGQGTFPQSISGSSLIGAYIDDNGVYHGFIAAPSH